MEKGGSETMPKFNTPEEEIAYLRAHISERENNLGYLEGGVNKTELAREALAKYERLPTESVLPAKRVMTEEEHQEFVLRLSPETHDNKMEELLGILLHKGIKNTLDIIERMNDPHIDDDFHRFLVQYIEMEHGVPGLKEKTPLANSLKMRLFEISLPDKEESDTRAWKELIGAMEQFYSGMQSVGDGRDNFDQHLFTIEIAVSNNDSEVNFYVSVPHGKSSLLEKQILAIHPHAKITEIFDDYNIFIPEGGSAGAYAQFATNPIFPIKTYDEFEHDPLNIILNAFAKLKKEGEGAAIQIVVRPKGNSIMTSFRKVLDEVKKGESLPSDSMHYSGLSREIGRVVGEIFKGRPNTDNKKVNDVYVEEINKKMKSSILPVNIRVMTSAESRQRAEDILKEMEAAFNQFSETQGNEFDFKKVPENKLKYLTHDFSYRLWSETHALPMNLKELSTIIHFPWNISTSPELKTAKAAQAGVPAEILRAGKRDGVLLGINTYRGVETPIYLGREDRVRHFYCIGQTGTGKTSILKNMIIQDIQNGDGVCFIDPHGTDVQDILANIPVERLDDVIYFDPSYTARPMGLNMLEYDPRYPEQKTFVVNELLSIFNKLFDMKVAGGPAFEQYFRNSALLVMEHPESGNTLLEIGRVLADKPFRDMKLSHCKNPIITQFWENAEKTTGEQSLANFVPYITNKFDVFISNDIMRPVIAQEKSVFNFREIMDNKKILLVNLAKGRLGEINANLIGLILVGKIQMAALSRVDMFGTKMNDFYLYIDEFQNVTTDSIASILSEARKYRLSLNIAHQYIAQLEESIKNAVFGNVGSMAVFRISSDDAKYMESKFEPTFKASDIMQIENYNAYISMLVDGTPVKPFSIKTIPPISGNQHIVEKIKELSYLTYGVDRDAVEKNILDRYRRM